MTTGTKKTKPDSVTLGNEEYFGKSYVDDLRKSLEAAKSKISELEYELFLSKAMILALAKNGKTRI